MDILREIWQFLRARKKLWLAPIIAVMLVLGGLLILAQGSVVAPLSPEIPKTFEYNDDEADLEV